MGYSASWGGYIRFKEEPSNEIEKKIDKELNVYYKENNTINVGNDGKYHDDEVFSLLNEIKDLVEDGMIEYNGEDHANWRIYFKNGNWLEETGYVYYESEIDTAQNDQQEFIGSIIDIIQDCIDNPHGEVINGDWYDKVSGKLNDLMYEWKVFH